MQRLIETLKSPQFFYPIIITLRQNDLLMSKGQEKDVSLFLDRTGEPAKQQQVSSRLKNKDTSFSKPTTHPKSF